MFEVQNEQRFNEMPQQDDEEETMLRDHKRKIEDASIYDTHDEAIEEPEDSSGEEVEVQSEGETQGVLEETELPPRT